MIDTLRVAREYLVTKDFLRSEPAITKSELRTEIANSKNETIRWLLGSQVIMVALLVALSNFTKVFA